MNGGFERARAVFGSEAALGAILEDMNRAVFGLSSAGTATDAAAPDDKTLN